MVTLAKSHAATQGGTGGGAWGLCSRRRLLNCSTGDGLIKSQQAHTDLQHCSRSGSIWKAKTKHVPFRNKTRLNSSLPFSFKMQVYRVVSGRSKDPCPLPPRAEPGTDRIVAVLESSALALQTPAFHCLFRLFSCSPSPKHL